MWATPNDVAARWRPLSTSETETAAALLEDATDLIVSSFPDIDGRLDAGLITTSTLRRVTCSMVKRAMIGLGSDGVSAQSQGAGPFSLQQTFANPTGNLYLTADERASLSGDSADGTSRMGWLL